MKKLLTTIACSLVAFTGFANPPLNSGHTHLSAPKEDLEIKIYRQAETIPLLPLLNTWVVNSFGPFPYLYAPREDQIVSVTDFVFANEKNSLVLVARKGDRVVGVATGIALDSFYLSKYFEPELISTMKDKDYDPSEYFYVAYFVLAPEFRGDLSIVEPIYDALAQFAKGIGKTHLTYIDIQRGENHPLRPAIFSSPEPWGTVITGVAAMDLYTCQTWPTFQTDGSIVDQEHTLQFFRKSL